MPRKARDEKLDTRTARLRLAPRAEPYFRSIQPGHAVGYRRLPGGRGGTWIARNYSAGSGRQYLALGAADDLLDADGHAILTFAQAQQAAADWFKRLARDGGKMVEPVTVAQAVESYIAAYDARSGKDTAAVRQTCKAHILPALGGKLVADLTAPALTAWHRHLATAPARLRTPAKATKQATRAKLDPKDIDGRRARQATANRILTALKAILNHAFRELGVTDDNAWRKVRAFGKVDAPRIRFLTDAEASRLVNACPADLRAIVTAALLTGCRYGELTTLRATDVDLSAGVLTVRAGVAKSGKARGVVLTEEGKRFFSGRAAGKASGALLMLRGDGEPWGKSHQFRPLHEACVNASVDPVISFHVLRHTYGSRLARLGVPMQVISAQLGHADTRITERHYAHLAPGFVADTVRAAFGDLGLVPAAGTVMPMRSA